MGKEDRVVVLERIVCNVRKLTQFVYHEADEITRGYTECAECGGRHDHSASCVWKQLIEDLENV